MSINKGEIVKRLIASNLDCDFVFCAGDDKTDEDMFKVLKKLAPGSAAASPTPGNRLSVSDEAGIFTCTVGASTKKTLAAYHVPESEDVVRLLTQLSLANTMLN